MRGVGIHCMYIHTYRCMCPKVPMTEKGWVLWFQCVKDSFVLPMTDDSDKGRWTSAVALHLKQAVGCKGEVPPVHWASYSSQLCTK